MPLMTAVEAHIHGKVVQPDPIELRKGDGDHVLWDSDTDVTVHFLPKPGHNGTPFTRDSFKVGKGTKVDSGPIHDKAEVCKKCENQPAAPHYHYKYEILDANGVVLADPEIIIRN